MMKVSSNQTPTAIGMRTGLAELDETVAATIKSYYAEPIKIAVDGRRFHLAVTSVRESEALVLARLATTFGRDGTLEIGLALGGSAVAIAAAAQSMGYAPHVVLDPYSSRISDMWV
jgi:predicted O-methyltransferase YrrM